MNFAKLKFKGEVIPIVYNLSEDRTQGIFSSFFCEASYENQDIVRK